MKNIVLIGFMGCGKSTLGIKLSYKLKKQVVDTDRLIEQKEGMSIPLIFEEKGEDYFRSAETEVLKGLSQNVTDRIISCGGGIIKRTENIALLKQCGTVVYLRMKPETAYERLKNDTTRPLLRGDDPLGKIRALLDERKSAYESAADIIIDVDGLEVYEVLERVLENTARHKEYKKKLLVINGPNINFLGIREKSVYGNEDYEYLVNMLKRKGAEEGVYIEVFQSNHEGAIIDRIQEAYFDKTCAIVINPGAYTHYSYAIRDALASITVPKVEIHISNIMEREEFRHISVTKDVCDHQIYGRGLKGYLDAVDFCLDKVR